MICVGESDSPPCCFGDKAANRRVRTPSLALGYADAAGEGAIGYTDAARGGDGIEVDKEALVQGGGQGEGVDRSSAWSSGIGDNSLRNDGAHGDNALVEN